MSNFTTNIFNLNKTTTNIIDLACLMVKPEADFPEDIFTLEQRQHGAVILHIFVAVYIIGNFLISFYRNFKDIYYIFFLSF